MLIAIVIILIVVVISLILYNVNIHKKIQTYKNINQKINNLSIVQDFMSTIGETSTVDEKIKNINNILIEKYEIKYSTIVVFNGAEYEIKASNVDERHWDSLRSLQDVDIFKDSIAQATPKYVTVNNEGERLPYQKMEFGRAKSAIFFPLYIDNVYIGYWIIESGTPHDFDNVDTTVLEVIKDNIVSVLKTVVHQKTLESIVRKDLFSGLYSEEYLYGEGRKVIDQYTTSTVCMFKITNLEEINKKYSRELGNEFIIEISDFIKDNISNQYVFVFQISCSAMYFSANSRSSGVSLTIVPPPSTTSPSYMTAACPGVTALCGSLKNAIRCPRYGTICAGLSGCL